MSLPTPEESVANWQHLYDAFRRETPSSPAWFQIADVAIGVLLADRLATEKAMAARSASPSSTESPR